MTFHACSAAQRSRLVRRPTRRMRDVIISVMPPPLQPQLTPVDASSSHYCQAALESNSPPLSLSPLFARSSWRCGPLLMPHIDSALNSRQFAPIAVCRLPIADCRLLIAVNFSLVTAFPDSLPNPNPNPNPNPIPIPLPAANVHFLPQRRCRRSKRAASLAAQMHF